MNRHAFAVALLAPLAAWSVPGHADEAYAALEDRAVRCSEVIELEIERDLFEERVFCVDMRAEPCPWAVRPIEELAADSVLVVLPDLDALLVLEAGDRVELRGVPYETPVDWLTGDRAIELDLEDGRSERVVLGGDREEPTVEAALSSSRGWVSISPVPVPSS